MNPQNNWKYFGKIAASVALSVLIGLFWISNYQNETKVLYPNDELLLGKVFGENLSGRTLVFFWATWCESCKTDIEGVKTLSENSPSSDFKILAVNIDEQENKEQANFIWNEAAPAIELLYDQDKKYQNALSVDVLPTYFVFDKDGRTLLRLDGKIDWADPKVQKLIFSKDL